MLAEALDPLGRLAQRATERGLGLGSKVIGPDGYKELKSTQAALRSSYSSGLDELLARAESEGPRARESLLADFEDLARRHLGRAMGLGLGVTAANSGAAIDDKFIERYLDERSNHDRLHFLDFLNKIWNDDEVMDRDKRRDLYVNNLDAMFHQGALAGTQADVSINWKISPAEHCIDCLTLAANGPYAKPGVDSELEELPTVPRRGDTECLANCKCFLTFVAPETGARTDPEEKEGVTITDEEGDPIADEEITGTDEFQAVQDQADALQQEMQYDSAMAKLTGDPEWIEKRKLANEALIQLQEESGYRFVPNAPAGKMLDLVREAEGEGWEVGYEGDAGKFAEGQVVGLVHDAEFSRGALTSWDAESGIGEVELLDGRSFPVGTAAEVESILLGRKLGEIPARPWAIEIPEEYPNAVPYDLPGRSNAVLEVTPDTTQGDIIPTYEAVREALESRPQAESHGLNVWLTGIKERGAPLTPDLRPGFGRGGIELIPNRNAIALRGANGGLIDAAVVEDSVRMGMGARLFQEAADAAEIRSFRRLLDDNRGLLGDGMRLFINGTPEEQGFGVAYNLWATDPGELETRARGLFEFVRDLVSGAVAGVSA